MPKPPHIWGFEITLRLTSLFLVLVLQGLLTIEVSKSHTHTLTHTHSHTLTHPHTHKYQNAVSSKTQLTAVNNLFWLSLQDTKTVRQSHTVYDIMFSYSIILCSTCTPLSPVSSNNGGNTIYLRITAHKNCSDEWKKIYTQFCGVFSTARCCGGIATINVRSDRAVLLRPSQTNCPTDEPFLVTKTVLSITGMHHVW